MAGGLLECMDGPAEDGGTVCGTINMAVCRNVTESTTTALHNTASGGRAAAAAEEPAEEEERSRRGGWGRGG
eukprot:COSAG01_NODE_54304_length_333_cov_0.576923_2_plen_71_part_01